LSESDTSGARAGGSGAKRHDIFMSYASPDKAAAEAVCQALEAAGFRCWMAPRDTEAGAYSRSIIESIRTARMLVLVLSPHSDRSPNVLSEVAEAFDRKVALLPFRLAEFEVSDDLRFFIRTHHWIDAFPGPVEHHVPRLVERARARLIPIATGPADPPVDRVSSTKRPTERFSRDGGAGKRGAGRRRWRHAAAAALAVAVGVGGYFGYDDWRERREQARWEEARVAVNDAIAKAHAAIESGQFDEAFAQVDRAAAIDPESVSLDDARRALIAALVARANAADRRRRALDRVDRGRDAIRRRDYGTAQRLFDDAERLDARAADFRTLRAGLPAYMRESAAAEEARRRAEDEARRRTDGETQRAKREEEAARSKSSPPRARDREAQEKPPVPASPPPPSSAQPPPPQPPPEPAKLAAGTAFRDCAECPELVVVPPGNFTMGSADGEKEHENNEGPQRKVSIAKAFAIGKYAVTFAEFDACNAAGGCALRLNDGGWGRGKQPAIHVSWDDARTYLAWLSKKTGHAYRLPSEAEWEYAARAGAATRYSWGDTIGRNNANCAGCGSRWDGKQPAPVGSFAANAFGLHDMHGNVWQWVADCWHDSYRSAPADGTEWTVAGECARRGLRGGAFFSYPKSLRAAYRYAYEPRGRLGNIGFRAVRELP